MSNKVNAPPDALDMFKCGAIAFVSIWYFFSLTSAIVISLALAISAVLIVSINVYAANKVKETLPEVFEKIVRNHHEALARKRQILIALDDYGNSVTTRWDDELSYFYKSVVQPGLQKHFDSQLEKERCLELGSEQAFLAWFRKSDPLYGISSRLNDKRPRADIDPIEYEHWCSNALQEAGWKAKATQASGDQGADILAEKDGIRLVVQCKLYYQPVGNKAVQEAYAAKQFYHCQVAAVVSNQSYTRSAQDLARTAGVYLLHDSQLADFAPNELRSRSTPPRDPFNYKPTATSASSRTAKPISVFGRR